MAREGWGYLNNGVEAVAGVDDGPVRPEEGDKGSLDVVEGWRVG